MSEHKHIWSVQAHHDSCHAYETISTCLCGAERHTGAERDISEDPLSAIWLLDQDCQRCQDLLAGADPERWDEVVPA